MTRSNLRSSLASLRWILVLGLPAALLDAHPASVQAARPTGEGALISSADRASLISAIQRDAAGVYAIASRDGELVATNPSRRIETTFSRDGVAVRPRGERTVPRASVGLTGIGCEGQIEPVSRVEPQADKNRVEYKRKVSGGHVDLVEWYLNGPMGLEQGFDISNAPCDSGPLVLEMDLGRDTHAVVRGTSIDLTGEPGAPPVRYGSLHVHDANRREIPAKMTLAGQRLALVVDTRQAAFPIVVDPLIGVQPTSLLSDAADDAFGKAIDVSGTTLVVGVPDDDDSGNSAGAVYVFEKTTGWALQQKIVPASATTGSSFGFSVAVSGDTLVASADMIAYPQRGSVYVFQRANGVWAEQAHLTEAVPTDVNQFGYSVDIDGDTLVAGIPFSSYFTVTNQGGASVFFRTGTTWVEQTGVTFQGSQPFAYFGSSVSISGDTIAVGAPNDGVATSGEGSVTMFKRAGSTWSSQGKLGASNASASASFGTSVALDGSTLVVGAPAAANGAGLGYIFEDMGSGAWTQRTILSDATSMSFGTLVALSSGQAVVMGVDLPNSSRIAYSFAGSGSSWTEGPALSIANALPSTFGTHGLALQGSELFVGAVNDSSNGYSSGVVIAYDDPGTGWVEGARLASTPGTRDDKFGISVAIDGTTAVVGAPFESEGDVLTGAAYVYGLTPNGWVRQQTLGAGIEPNSDSLFGTSVAISGTTIVVGAPGESSYGPAAGAAFTFYFDASLGLWLSSAYIAPPNPQPNSGFGTSVALDSDRIAVGAPTTLGTGMAYVFEMGEGWFASGLLAPLDSNPDLFGASVSISGTSVIVGAPGDSEHGANAGASYVYLSDGIDWNLEAKLNDPSTVANDAVGTSVVIKGDLAMVGAPTTGANGYVSVFERSGTAWAPTQKLSTPACQGLGRAVSLDAAKNLAVVGGQSCVDLWSKPGAAWQHESTSVVASTTPSVGISGEYYVVGAPVQGDRGAATVYLIRSANGDTCVDGTTCASGVCTEGVCCDTECTGACMSCLGANKGFCSPVTLGDDPDTCTGALSCDATGVCKSANGVSCSADAACASGFCVDGVCCNAACGGTTSNDCQACSMAEGASQDGSCTLLPSTHECRAAGSACDVVETCTGADPLCPTDVTNCAGAGGTSGLPDLWGVGDGAYGGTGASAGGASGSGGSGAQNRPNAIAVGDTSKGDETSNCSVSTVGAARARSSSPMAPTLVAIGAALVRWTRRRARRSW